MFIYLLALPVWNFVLPVYAFWHFDDFSWGQTRMVEGESKKDAAHGHGGEGGSDSSIPFTLQRWEEWEKARRHAILADRSKMKKRNKKLYDVAGHGTVGAGTPSNSNEKGSLQKLDGDVESPTVGRSRNNSATNSNDGIATPNGDSSTPTPSTVRSRAQSANPPKEAVQTPESETTERQ
jgi:hypothetical protein